MVGITNLNNQIRLEKLPHVNLKFCDPNDKQLFIVYGYQEYLQLRVKVKELKLEGYYFLLNNEVKYKLDSDGRICNREDDLYSHIDDLLDQLID